MKLGVTLSSIPASDRRRLEPDYGYLSTLFGVLMSGERREDRTGVGTISHFGARTLYTNLQDRFPLLTVKNVWWHGIAHELLWFLKGDTNTQYLLDNGVRIWDEWADKDGNLGPVYGHQWRKWSAPQFDDKGFYLGDDSIDQLRRLLTGLKEDPTGRRHILSAWNVGDLEAMALPPCHMMCQFYVRDRYLDCQMYQRSADMFLGVPFNIASYAALTHILARLTDLKPGRLIHLIGDAHIYLNHLDAIDQMLASDVGTAPKLVVSKGLKDIDALKFSDLKVSGYKPGPSIPAPVAV